MNRCSSNVHPETGAANDSRRDRPTGTRSGDDQEQQAGTSGVVAVKSADQNDNTPNSVTSSTEDLQDQDDQQPSTSSLATEAPAAEQSRVEGLLVSINNQMEARLRKDDEMAELRGKTEKDQKKKKDWMTAAAVIDRLCLIIFVVMFVVGTSVPFILATFNFWE